MRGHDDILQAAAGRFYLLGGWQHHDRKQYARGVDIYSRGILYQPR